MAMVDSSSAETEAAPVESSAWSWVADVFRSLRHRNYLLYFLGQFVSITGSWLQTTALMWVAYKKTGLSVWSGAISAAQILPTFFLGIWGGRLADRVPKRPLIFATQAAALVQAVILAILVFAGLDSPWILLAIALVAGIINAIDLPARMAFVVEMVGREDLVNAVALNSLLFNAARAMGPACRAYLLRYLGAGMCFLANGLSFVAVLWALFLMDPRRLNSRRHAHEPQSLRDGLRFLGERPWLLGLVFLSGAMALFGWPIIALLPAVAKKELGGGPELFGVLLSAIGIGAMVAALFLAAFGSLSRRGWFIAGGVALDAAGMALLALVRVEWQAVIAGGLVGCGLILFFATAQSVTQLSSGDHNRGLIMGIWSMVLCGANPLGNWLAGQAADRWGVPVVLNVLALGVAVAGVAVVVVVRGAVEHKEPVIVEPTLPRDTRIIEGAKRFGVAARRD